MGEGVPFYIQSLLVSGFLLKIVNMGKFVLRLRNIKVREANCEIQRLRPSLTRTICVYTSDLGALLTPSPHSV